MTQDEIKEAREVILGMLEVDPDSYENHAVCLRARRFLVALESRELRENPVIDEPTDHEAEGAMRYVMARQAE